MKPIKFKVDASSAQKLVKIAYTYLKDKRKDKEGDDYDKIYNYIDEADDRGETVSVVVRKGEVELNTDPVQLGNPTPPLDDLDN